ncbi:MAG: hypothetical protein EBZ50_15450 [Alphaproteobacteria bacterium]|nr:hypothetical protein [Alphaproteobacteria bacterium]
MRTIAAIVLTALALVTASADRAFAKPAVCAPKGTSARLDKIVNLAVEKRADAFMAVLAEAQNVKPSARPAEKLACAAVGASAGLALASDLKLPAQQALNVEAQLQAIAQEGRGLCGSLATGGEDANVRRNCFLIDVASATWPAYSAAHRLSAAARDPTFPKNDEDLAELERPISAAAALARTRWRALSDSAASRPLAEVGPILSHRKSAACAIVRTYANLMLTAPVNDRAPVGAAALDETERSFLADAGEALYSSDPQPAACAADAGSADCRMARRTAMRAACVPGMSSQ